ncbi:hypothetical protein KUTeg_004848 [Tegillarca granosa]|uniref:Ankyrin repeat domain-containing protein 55 n=1 Tax=Tegillarca granosa TaxID=220873 RepID=A0ABQ9FI21_TEGGR|nr:hypothetical protein KUTeg_004848 [Tegillarca granosa]
MNYQFYNTNRRMDFDLEASSYKDTVDYNPTEYPCRFSVTVKCIRTLALVKHISGTYMSRVEEHMIMQLQGCLSLTCLFMLLFSADKLIMMFKQRQVIIYGLYRQVIIFGLYRQVIIFGLYKQVIIYGLYRQVDFIIKYEFIVFLLGVYCVFIEFNLGMIIDEQVLRKDKCVCPMIMDGESDADAEALLAHRAASQGEINLLVQAIQEDPSVLEQEDGEGCTPLTLAVQSQQMGVVKRLVKMGANTNAQDGQGRTCLSIAAYQTNLQYLELRYVQCYLRKKMTGLHWAAFHNRPEHTQMLILRGADITCQDVDGKTPLHWAAQNGSSRCCHILVQNCSSMAEFVNQQDFSGKNAIHYAVAAGHAEVLQELATVQGCELEAEDPDDRTPLHWAAAMGHPQCVSILLKLGVTPNPVDVEGGTPLDYARQSGHNECKFILEERLGIKPSPNTDDKKKVKKSSDTLPFKIRKNPIGVLKDLFRPKHKKTAAISTNNNVTNESIEMTMFMQQDKQKSNKQKNNKNSIKSTTNVQNTQQKMSEQQQTKGELREPSDSSPEKGVPKITLTSYDVEGILNATEQKKKMKKSKKLSAIGLYNAMNNNSIQKTPSEDLAPPGRYDNIQSIGSRVSPMLPPVLGPRISPLPPITPLPEDPPPRKKSEDFCSIACLVIHCSGSNKLINDKVAALRREKEGSKNRTPTPPPNIWAISDKSKKHGDLSVSRPAPSLLINDTTYKGHDFYKQNLQKNTSPWLQVDDQDLLTAPSRSRTGESFTTGSSLSIPSASSEIRKLSSLQDQSGYNSTFRETPRMTAMEKKALDRTIQSLLH